MASSERGLGLLYESEKVRGKVEKNRCTVISHEKYEVAKELWKWLAFINLIYLRLLFLILKLP